MVLTIVYKKSPLPEGWRTTFAEIVSQLPVPELGDAFSKAKEILAVHSEAAVDAMADTLLQSIAVAQGAKPHGVGADASEVAVDPRTVFNLLSSSGTATPPTIVSIKESLAVGLLVALRRACEVLEAANDKASWLEAIKAVSTARGFAEWIYIVCMKNGGLPKFATPPSTHEIRAAVKEKIKNAKSNAAKKGARKATKPDKQLIFEYYEQHKSEFKTIAQAATAIDKLKLTLLTHSTIYRWLLAFVKAAKLK